MKAEGRSLLTAITAATCALRFIAENNSVAVVLCYGGVGLPAEVELVSVNGTTDHVDEHSKNQGWTT